MEGGAGEGPTGGREVGILPSILPLRKLGLLRTVRKTTGLAAGSENKLTECGSDFKLGRVSNTVSNTEEAGMLPMNNREQGRKEFTRRKH